MPDPSRHHSSLTSRRNFIKYGAAGSLTLLAGCSGDGGGDGGDGGTGGDGGDGGTGGDGGDGGSGGNNQRFRVFDPLTSGATPSERHFNPWNPTQTGCWHPGALIFDRPAVYSPTQNEAYPLMATGWEMPEDNVLEATFSEEWEWHNGDQFVAQDYVMEQQIDIEIRRANADEGERAHPTISSIEATDDQTARIELHDPLSEIFAVQNTIGAYNGNLARGVFVKHDDDQWSEWHERLRNSSGSEKAEVVTEITSTKYPTIDEVIGHGPFQISEVGDNIIVAEKYEGHPNSENINFDEFSLNLFTSGQPVQPYAAQEVDAAHKGFPVQEDLRPRLPENHTLFREGRSSNKLFSFNCGYEIEGYDTPFESVPVRKAVAHVFDKQQVSSLLQGVNRLFEWAPCRVPGKVLTEGTIDVSNFPTYGQNNTERATELLEGEGYTQDGSGNWMTPDGNRFELDIMNGTQRPDFQVLIQNLEDFGIAVNQEQVDSATFDERRVNGQYDIMPDGSSANGITAMWSIGLVPEWIQSITHFKPEREVPMPVGDPSGSNGTKTINVEEHIRQWQATGNDQYHTELMWWWNQTLPEYEVMYQPDAGAYNAANWNLDVRDGIRNGVDDALYIAPKMADGTISYQG